VSTISVMQPVSDSPRPARSLTTRPRDLAGLSVGFVDEGIIPPTRWLMAALERELVARAGIGRIVRARVAGRALELVEPGTGRAETISIPGPPVDELSRWCAAAVTGVGY
jgi:hypothetical protein